MKKSDVISIRGAREHNLKDISVEIPRDSLTVITGLSGSGKSSLAFDTLFAEGQRRYVESLSAYARQFLSLMEKPDVDHIERLSPAVAIEQRRASHNPRSTVATVTEIYDYLRLLYARIGTPYCYKCGRPVTRWSVQGIVDKILEWPEGKRIIVLAPLVRSRKGEFRDLLDGIARDGFVRVRIDGEIRPIDEKFELSRNIKHDIEIVVDRLVVKEGIHQRLTESIEIALKFAEGMIIVLDLDDGEEHLFSENYACPHCGISFEELSPRSFSFNSPYGACPQCDGLGTERKIDPDLIVPDPTKSIMEGAIKAWGDPTGKHWGRMVKSVAAELGVDLYQPWNKLPEEFRKTVLYGSGKREFTFRYESTDGRASGKWKSNFEGIIPNLKRRFQETKSQGVRMWIERFMSLLPCPACGGSRLRPEARSVRVGDRPINEIVSMSIAEGLRFFLGLGETLSERDQLISKQVLKEIIERLGFLDAVGVGYLTLDRQSSTLSGGEAQRIHLATQIGSRLVGVMYVLDEPSIGLHQRDNIRLIATLESMRDLGNTVIVVEHDRETIEASDFIIDLGPGAGIHGGEVVCTGTPKEVAKCDNSHTGRYLSGKFEIPVPKKRRKGTGKKLVIEGASGNNLANIDVEIPLGQFVCISGVSGSGKSTLINETLYPILARHYTGKHVRPLPYRFIRGLEHIDKVIDIDQSPIGRTPRSNPATYTGAFTPIRDLFASLPESRARGYKPGRFSFNVKGGRCETCGGGGTIRLEMHFLPDVYVPCDVCGGLRYNRETLQIRYKGKNISEVLDMTVEEATDFFSHISSISNRLNTLKEVGLGYIQLGQSAINLSGGEAQRVKLASELSRRSTGKTLYILDEPTVGLHAYDVKILLDVLDRLVDLGNTVLVIEHNLDVLKVADYIIDLGPEGGDMGGTVVARGTPEEVAKVSASHTASFLRKTLMRRA
ncbi:MAG TPA: excinuclease ABC subunit UvrA [candidate division Zixibacteria bacterium]|nr:excinuclease ABC subunit UvrA [candidate division Zixibacteria bacterium]